MVLGSSVAHLGLRWEDDSHVLPSVSVAFEELKFSTAQVATWPPEALVFIMYIPAYEPQNSQLEVSHWREVNSC